MAFISVKSTGNLSCLALGKQLSSLKFTPGKFDIFTGFTCWTPDKENRWNSSDPNQAASLGSSGNDGTSTTLTNPASPTGTGAENLTSVGAAAPSTTTEKYVRSIYMIIAFFPSVILTELLDLKLEMPCRLDS